MNLSIYNKTSNAIKVGNGDLSPNAEISIHPSFYKEDDFKDFKLIKKNGNMILVYDKEAVGEKTDTSKENISLEDIIVFPDEVVKKNNTLNKNAMYKEIILKMNTYAENNKKTLLTSGHFTTLYPSENVRDFQLKYDDFTAKKD